MQQIEEKLKRLGVTPEDLDNLISLMMLTAEEAVNPQDDLIQEQKFKCIEDLKALLATCHKKILKPLIQEMYLKRWDEGHSSTSFALNLMADMLEKDDYKQIFKSYGDFDDPATNSSTDAG